MDNLVEKKAVRRQRFERRAESVERRDVNDEGRVESVERRA